ncbi:Deoxyribonuclease-2-alpha [Nymphon striatum]|nr:Deoxyribonuclease-2-alpha [Nymphon striatum]
MNSKIQVLLLLLSCNFFEVLLLSCKNEDGKDVDCEKLQLESPGAHYIKTTSEIVLEGGFATQLELVFMIEKLPRLTDSRNDISNGKGYVYLDSSNSTWKEGKSQITDDSNPLGNTLSDLYSKSKNIAYIIFNDEKPSGSWTEDFGHTKGFLAADNNTGFYVTHSVPKFPPAVANGYGYPHSGEKYGQAAMCISIKSDQVDKIGQYIVIFFHFINFNANNKPKKYVGSLGAQIRINEPWVYDHNMPADLKANYPNLYKAMIQEVPDHDSRVSSFSSANGTIFTSFAKSGDYGKDLYASLVAQKLETDIQTETWWIHCDQNRLNASCDTDYKVYNVENLNYDVVDVSFTNYNDHSKFVVSVHSQKPWVCVGDINRATTQFRRGGGTTCLKDLSIWKSYHNIVTKTDDCDSRQ